MPLDGESQRAIVTPGQLTARAEHATVDRVFDQEAIELVDVDRPELLDRRRTGETQAVPMLAIERPVLAVACRHRVAGVLDQVAADPEQGPRRAQRIFGAEPAHVEREL